MIPKNVLMALIVISTLGQLPETSLYALIDLTLTAKLKSTILAKYNLLQSHPAEE